MARGSALVHCIATAVMSLGVSAAAADPPRLEAADAEARFVAAAVARYGGPRQASRAIANAGWTLLRANRPDDALAVFDHALLVDPDYYDGYWGVGAVLQARGRIDAAIVAFERANRLPDVDEPNRGPLLSDLANLYALKAFLLAPEEAARAEYFGRANALFATATALDPANPQPWLQWVAGLYYEGRYAEGWRKVAAARALGHSVPESLLEPLRAKHPEPAR